MDSEAAAAFAVARAAEAVPALDVAAAPVANEAVVQDDEAATRAFAVRLLATQYNETVVQDDEAVARALAAEYAKADEALAANEAAVLALAA